MDIKPVEKSEPDNIEDLFVGDTEDVKPRRNRRLERSIRRGTDTTKPPPKPRAPRAPKAPEVDIARGVSAFVARIGLALTVLGKVRDNEKLQLDGLAVMNGAERMGTAVQERADRDVKFKALMEKVFAGSDWAGILGAMAAIGIPIIVNHEVVPYNDNLFTVMGITPIPQAKPKETDSGYESTE